MQMKFYLIITALHDEAILEIIWYISTWKSEHNYMS